jgi:hypothetical protein
VSTIVTLKKNAPEKPKRRAGKNPAVPPHHQDADFTDFFRIFLDMRQKIDRAFIK